MRISVAIDKRLRAEQREFHLQVEFMAERDPVVIFGPSGSGKTVTLQAIAGLLKPDHGHIQIGARMFFDSARGVYLPACERRIGYVFQDYALFPHLTVAQNVAFPLRRWWERYDRQTMAEHVLPLLETLEIADIGDSYPSQISGGQKQRAALARALIGKPDLLLLDEPFAALDTPLRQRMRQELLRIRAHFRVPMVLITHDPEDVKMFGATLIRFQNGSVLTGEPDAYTRTSSPKPALVKGKRPVDPASLVPF